MNDELEQFIGRGEEKVFWLISQKNILGFVLGMLTGQGIGDVLFGDGGLAVLCTILGVIGGVVVTFQYHGLLIFRRLAIRLRFYLRRAVRPTLIDAERLFPPRPPQEEPIQIFRYDGTPVIVAQLEHPQ